jgi:TRAP-type C4-dicarboxylate transport system substrate-binding protein
MRRFLFALGILLGLWFLPGVTRVFAGEQHVIRIATLAPRGTPAFKTLDMWNAKLQEKTGGRVKLTFLAGGVAGDERDVIRKMKVGQIDGSGLSSVGLGQIYRPILVLQMPGMFQNDDELHAVRKAMDPAWKQEFKARGFVMLGWFDVGFGRVFSKQPIERPTDYRKVRAWMWREDPMFPSFMEIVGATGVPLGLPEVFPALSTGMVDTVVASSVAAVGLQWFRYLTHMSAEASVAIVGASLITKSKFDSLPKDAQEILLETSPLAHEKLNEDTRVAEKIAHQTLLSRGMKVFYAQKYEAEWIEAGRKLREKLIGRLFTREMIEHVEALVQEARKAKQAAP